MYVRSKAGNKAIFTVPRTSHCNSFHSVARSLAKFLKYLGWNVLYYDTEFNYVRAHYSSPTLSRPASFRSQDRQY